MDYEKFLQCCGYETGLRPIRLSKDLERVYSFLAQQDLSFSSRWIFKSRKRIAEETKAFYDEFFTIHSVIVLPASRVIGFNGAIKADGDYLKAMQNYCVRTSPFDISIDANYNGSNSYNVKDAVRIKNEDEERVSDPFFSSIILAAPFTTLTPCSYAHEIAHTQLNSNYGSSTDYHNLEVITIFIEKLRAYTLGNNLIKSMERKRLQGFVNDVTEYYSNPDCENELMCYIISTLKAEKLFDMYINSDELTKTLIIKKIQEVFDGETTLEQLLEDFDISLKNSMNTDSIKRNLSLSC